MYVHTDSFREFYYHFTIHSLGIILFWKGTIFRFDKFFSAPRRIYYDSDIRENIAYKLNC